MKRDGMMMETRWKRNMVSMMCPTASGSGRRSWRGHVNKTRETFRCTQPRCRAEAALAVGEPPVRPPHLHSFWGIFSGSLAPAYR
jgi:hypothetical protein